MKEADIEKSVCEFARKNGCLVYKFVSPSHRGAPDRIFIKNGRFMLVEFKQKGKKPTPLQERELNILRGAGAVAEWADSVLKGTALVRQHLL